MLYRHRERNADRMARLIVISAGRAVAKNDLRTRERILKMRSIDFLETAIRLRQQPAQSKHPEEIIIEIERGRGRIELRKGRAVRLKQIEFRTLAVPAWGFLFDLFSRSVQSFMGVVTLLFRRNDFLYSVVRLTGISILIILAASLPLRAQTVADYAGEFLELGVGARSLALGGAGAAISEDATAGYWNPAGLNALRFPMLTAMHESRFDGTVNYDYGAFALPLNQNSSAALSILHIGVSDILDTRNALVDINNNGQLDPNEYLDYSKVTTFGNYDWVAMLSYAKLVNSKISWGVNAKLIYRRLDPETTGSGLGFDAAVRYQPNEALTLAAVAQDITTTLLSYSTGTKELVSPTLIFGAAYLWKITSDGNHRLLPTVDADLRFENRGVDAQLHAGPVSADFHEGLEYEYKNIFALRGGYNDMHMWSAGAGITFSKFHIDYAYLGANAQDQLGSTHRISISFLLDNPKWKRP